MTTARPERVDPPSCGCSDCFFTGRSVPLNMATWQVIKALVNGDVQDNTGTELDVMVTVSSAEQRDWPDRQIWAWKYDAARQGGTVWLLESGHVNNNGIADAVIGGSQDRALARLDEAMAGYLKLPGVAEHDNDFGPVIEDPPGIFHRVSSRTWFYLTPRNVE